MDQEISPVAPPLGGRAVMRQRWSSVSFLHWRVDAAQVAARMPQGCVPDLIDGSAWVGLVAFQMSRCAFCGGPRIPWLGEFPEVNVRLYSVDDRGRRGVVFLSLEASRLVPVVAARMALGLRYQWASMRIDSDGETVSYRSRRFARAAASTRISVRPDRDPRAAAPAGSVETALTAQWAFHERHLGRTIHCRNHHAPWPLHDAELVELDDGLLAAAGFPGLADRAPDSVLYSPGVDTAFAMPSVLR